MDEDGRLVEPAAEQPGPGPEVVSSEETSTASPDNDPMLLQGHLSHKASRRLVIGALLALVIVAAAIGLAFALSGTPTTIDTGTGSATITWTPVSANADTVSTSPQPFQGTIEGIMASGEATTPLADGSAPSTTPSGAFPTKLEAAHWKGTFGGRPFSVGIFVQYSSNDSITNPSPTFPTVTIAGRWGSKTIKGVVDTPTAAEVKTGNGPLRFTGTVGDFKVSGTVQPPTGRTRRQSLASFTVSR